MTITYSGRRTLTNSSKKIVDAIAVSFGRDLSTSRDFLEIAENVISPCYPTGLSFQLNETVFEKTRNLEIDVEIYLFKNLVFDFESITMHSPCLNNTDSTTLFGKHVPMSVSIHSNFISYPIFCDINPRSFVTKFVLEVLDLCKRSSIELSQLFNPFLQLIQNKVEEINTKLPEEAHDDEMEEKALNVKLLRRHKQLYVGVKVDLESFCDNLPIFELTQ